MQLSKTIINKIKDNLDHIGNSNQLESCQVILTEQVDILPVLSQSTVSPILYFSKPEQCTQYVAFGQWAIFSTTEAHQCIQTYDDSVRLFGACAFDSPLSKPNLNQPFQHKEATFPSEYWVLPKCWLDISNQHIMLTIIFDLRNQSKVQCWNQLSIFFDQFNHQNQPHSIKQNQTYQNICHKPTKDAWDKSVQRVKHDIQNNIVKKVVLARQSTYQFLDHVDPFMLLHDIQESDHGVYHFCIKMDEHCSFIGGTPERLFEISDNVIESEAIAGSIFKPNNANVDALKTQLLQSSKDRSEHQLVVDDIESKMESLCRSYVCENTPSLIELKSLIHLIVTFKGTLADSVDWYDCLTTLHPTPAVAGTTIKKSIEIINQEESFSREWYAGPIGIVSKQSTQIVVAIRSGMVINDKVTLYAGAGIVAESNPDSEWNELNAKTNLFTQLFKGEGYLNRNLEEKLEPKHVS